MDKVTPDNTRANWAGNAAASRSADSSAQSEFAKTLEQEAQKSEDAGHAPVSAGPARQQASQYGLPKNERRLPPSSSQKSNGGSQVHGGETRTSTVDRQIGGILNNPHMSENEKVAELKKTIADLPDSEKKDLYERLKDRKSNDPLAQQFHYRLSHHPDNASGVSTSDQVLNALKSKSQAPAQDLKSAASGNGASPAATGAKTAPAATRDPTLSPDATGLKPGEPISAKVTTKVDIGSPKAAMTFDFSKQVTKDQAAAIIFQNGKVPEGATLTQGQGNQWTVEYRNDIYVKQDVESHLNSHTETVTTRNKMPGEMFFPKPDLTFSWVGGAKAYNTTQAEPSRRDLKNDMGFAITKRYPLDEGQSPDTNFRNLVQKGPGYEVAFDKPKTAAEVKETFFEKGVRDDQVRVIPVGKEPTKTWQVQMLDGQTPLKTPAGLAIQDANVYAKEAIPPMLPAGIKAHLENQTVPPNAKRFEPDVYVWEQDGHIVRVETNGKKGEGGYYKYEETKLLGPEDKDSSHRYEVMKFLEPNNKDFNDTMRHFMLQQGLPVHEAWQEFNKYWDQVIQTKAGIAGAMHGGSSAIPRMIGGGGRAPRSAWEEPISARGRGSSPRTPVGGGPGSPGGGGPRPSNTIVESPPPPPKPPGGNPGNGGPKPSNTIVESPPPQPKPYAGQNPAMGPKGTLPGNPPPVQPRPPGPKQPAAAPAAAPAAGAQSGVGRNIVPGRGRTMPGSVYRAAGKPSHEPAPEIPSLPKQSGVKLSKQQVYDVFNADKGRIGWSMTPEEHLRQWQAAHPGTKEPPPVAFTTSDGRVQVSEEGWIKSGEGPLWGYEPGGPSDSHH